MVRASPNSLSRLSSIIVALIRNMHTCAIAIYIVNSHHRPNIYNLPRFPCDTPHAREDPTPLVRMPVGIIYSPAAPFYHS